MLEQPFDVRVGVAGIEDRNLLRKVEQDIDWGVVVALLCERRPAIWNRLLRDDAIEASAHRQVDIRVKHVVAVEIGDAVGGDRGQDLELGRIDRPVGDTPLGAVVLQIPPGTWLGR